MKCKRVMSGFLWLVSVGLADAQQGIIKGKIIDAVNRESLAGAAVQIARTNNGAVTNLSGDFQLYSTAGEKNLKVRYLGYR